VKSEKMKIENRKVKSEKMKIENRKVKRGKGKNRKAQREILFLVINRQLG
jgi:hypothetical protein